MTRRSFGHIAFALAMIALGVTGLMAGTLPQIWTPTPSWVPARDILAWGCSLLSLVTGAGLLVQRSAFASARVLFFAWCAWLAVMRLPNLFYQKPLVLVAWSFGATAVMMAGAWLLYARLANASVHAPLTGARTQRFASALYGVSLIPFGLAHLLYIDATTAVIPSIFPQPAYWGYATGAAFIAAGLALVSGVLARWAAILSALQMALFGVIVWIPRVISGNITEFQRGEVITTFVLAAAGWVVAESFAGTGAAVSRYSAASAYVNS